MKVLSKLAGYKPLAVTSDQVILSRGRKLFTSDHHLTQVRPLCSLPRSRKRDAFGRIRLIDRVLRLSITTMIMVSDQIGYLNVGSEVWRINLATGDAVLDFVIPYNRKALSLTCLKNFQGYDNVIVFGDYYANFSGPMLGQGLDGPSTGNVTIWMRPHNDVSTFPKQPDDPTEYTWRPLQEFPDNTVDHIHGVVASPDGQQIFALVGDTGPNVGFWKWDNDIQAFHPKSVGDQVFRSTWAAFDQGKLVYATDTQLEENFLISLDPDHAKPQQMYPLEGSSIYASPTQTGLLFSSTVEPGKPSGRHLKDIFERAPGPGILSNMSKLYHFEFSTGKMQTVLSARKDNIPSRLGQFGSFMIPTGLENMSGPVIVYGNAIKGYDNCALLVALPLVA